MNTRIQKLLVGAALMGAAALVQAQFNYTNNGNGTCTITGYGGPGGAVIIPNSIAGLSVVSVGYRAFYYNSVVTNVTIPDSVTFIGDYAFDQCYNLGSVTIGGGVTFIGESAFAECSSLASVTIPGSVAGIGDYAFASCGHLTSVTMGDGVAGIGYEAFSYCYNLTNVSVPDSVTSIGDYAFYYCTSLTSVTVPASVTHIGDGVFALCPSLTAITVDAANSFFSSANGVLFDKDQTTLIQFPGGRGGSYTIPASVTSIRRYAFFGSSSLTGVTIPAGVTSIRDFTFFLCSHLTSATIPNSITSIGHYAFQQCYNLTSVTIPASVTSIGIEAFAECDSLTAAYFLGNAPPDGGGVFGEDYFAVVYYLPGAAGWGPTFGYAPTELWNPQASALRVTGGYFGFDISGPANTAIVVEACTNLAQPVWLPVSTNALNGSGVSSFSDSESGIYPARFYRFRSP